MVLKVISADDILFQGETDLVELPGAEGAFTVLKNHASLISTLVAGKIVYSQSGTKNVIDIDGGVVDVDNNIVSVCIY
ncbi:MAG: hypothetical protein NC343_01810 [Muribaculum sp.]|nr:hypothetical protein [Muribaculaceae bacterium]MCM1080471.1 hypothetical protein [Muribaculum sp.]